MVLWVKNGSGKTLSGHVLILVLLGCGLLAEVRKIRKRSCPVVLILVLLGCGLLDNNVNAESNAFRLVLILVLLGCGLLVNCSRNSSYVL